MATYEENNALNRAIRGLIKQFRFPNLKKFFHGFATFQEIMFFLAEKTKVPIESLPTQYILGKLKACERLDSIDIDEETYYYATQGVALQTHAYMRQWLEEKGASEDSVFKPVTRVTWVGHMTSIDVTRKFDGGEHLKPMNRAIHTVPVIETEEGFRPDSFYLKKATDDKKRYEKVVIIDFAKLLEMKANGQWEGFIWMNNAGVIQITANIPNNLLLTTTLSFSEFWSKKDVTNN